MGIIRQFLRDHVRGCQPGSLYISGAPGTGKTACLNRVLLDCKVRHAGGPGNLSGVGQTPVGGWGQRCLFWGRWRSKPVGKWGRGAALLRCQLRGGGSSLWPV